MPPDGSSPDLGREMPVGSQVPGRGGRAQAS